MKQIRTVCLTLGFVAALVGGTAGPGSSKAAEQSDNVHLVKTFPYRPNDVPFNVGGTDMAFDGRYAYAAEQGWEGIDGGVHIFDVSGPTVRKVGFAKCGGWQNDVTVVKPGLIAMGYHQGTFNCGNTAGGVTLIDVRNPKNPKVLGSTSEELPPGVDPVPGGYYQGVHTLTAYPGTDLIYTSPGGRQMDSETVETIIDVSDPRKPKVVATFDTVIGCHDLSFDIRKDRQLAFCGGVGETQIYDVADPLKPVLLSHLVNPWQSFHHSVAVSDDGKHAIVGTETAGNDCAGGPTGALVIYDISEPRVPLMLGHFGAQRGPSPVFIPGRQPAGDCAPHLFNLIPGTLTVVSGNYWGGMNVVDFSDPLQPKELAYYRTDKTHYWAAYWYKGRVFANGYEGLDVFEIDGL